MILAFQILGYIAALLALLFAMPLVVALAKLLEACAEHKRAVARMITLEMATDSPSRGLRVVDPEDGA